MRELAGADRTVRPNMLFPGHSEIRVSRLKALLFMGSSCCLLAGCRSTIPRGEEALEYLWRGSNPEALRGAIHDVAHHKDERAIPHLARLASGRRQNIGVRTKAVWALGALRNEQAFCTLTGIIQGDDKDDRLRLFAIRALGEYDDERVIPVILGAVLYKKPGATLIVGEVLARRKDKERAVEPLIDMLELEMKLKLRSEGLGKVAAGALGEIGDRRATEPLLRALESDNRYTKAAAILALGKLRDRRAVPALLKMLKAKKGSFVVPAAVALGQIGDESVVPVLIELVENGHGYWRDVYTIDALGSIKDRRAEPCLLAVLRDRGLPPSHHEWALRALAAMCDSDTDVEPVIPLLDSPYVGESARKVFEKTRGNEIDKVLASLIHDEDILVSMWARQALGLAQTDTPKRVLIEHVRDSLVDRLGTSKMHYPVRRDEFRSLVVLSEGNTRPLLDLLEKIGYSGPLAELAVTELVKHDDPALVLPIARCRGAPRACRAAVVPTESEDSTVGRFLINMGKTNPEALKVLCDSGDRYLARLGYGALLRSGADGSTIVLDAIRGKKSGWQLAVICTSDEDRRRGTRRLEDLLASLEDEEVREYVSEVIATRRATSLPAMPR